MVEEDQSHSSPKWLKIKETLEEDRISALPDCLILQILSLLPSTGDAIRTGTLSKRWKSLWTSVPTLIFVGRRWPSTYDQLNPDSVSFIDKTLTQCCHSKLNEFQLNISYSMLFECQVNNWIRYATSCNVENLNLTLHNSFTEDKCLLDQQFFVNSSFSDLKLDGFAFNPNGAISWKMLKSLRISSANLDEDLIENISSGSPVLETLELDYCYGYERLDITSKSVKNLVIHGYHNAEPYDYDGDDVIEINAPNILSLKIQSDLFLWKLLLLDVSSFVKAELDYTKRGYCDTTRKEAKEEMLKGLIQRLHHVKELKFGLRCARLRLVWKLKVFPFQHTWNFLKLLHHDSLIAV